MALSPQFPTDPLTPVITPAGKLELGWVYVLCFSSANHSSELGLVENLPYSEGALLQEAGSWQFNLALERAKPEES